MKRLLSLSAALIATTALSSATAPAQAQVGVSANRGFVPHQIVYKLRGQRLGRATSLPGDVSVAQAAAALQRNPRVLYAGPNYIATASAEAAPLPDDPGTLDGAAEASAQAGNWTFRQWNFLPFEEDAGSQVPTSPGGIDAVGAWRNLTKFGDPGAEGVTVAVLDTGVAYAVSGSEAGSNSARFPPSPDFGQRRWASGYDFIDNDHHPFDENGHGTHVAGTIGEQTNNGIGLTGLAYRARLMPVRVLDKQGRGNAVEIARGIRFAISNRAAVINMSFNFNCRRRVPIVNEALHSAYEHGIVTVASAGNLDSEGCVSEPATGPRVIAVGGTTEGGCLGSYSVSGPIDLLAPGGGEPVGGCPSILSRPIYQVTLEPGTTNAFWIPSNYAGTSMAAAHVSGVAAMVIALGHPFRHRNPHELPRATHIVNAVTKRLSKTARDLGLPRTEQGSGLIDAARATERRPYLR